MAKQYVKNNGMKKLKYVFYKGRALHFKRALTIMFVTGLVACTVWFSRYVYNGYAEASAKIILFYPEIAFSSLPDNSRFTYYDLISTENINAALDTMHKQGLYENFTAEDLQNCFLVHTTLEDSATDLVAKSRKAGNNYAFVANSYRLTFIQPHDYKSQSLWERVFTPDKSEEFVNALIEANRVKIAESAGGINAFKDLTVIDNASSYDFSEKLKIYKTKIREIKKYVSYINRNKSDFVSPTYDLSLKDIESRYDFLLTSDLDSISNLVESAVLSRDIDLAVNKLNVNIENNQLKYNKHLDRAEINAYAMENYDQAFTENLISIVRDEDYYGLYQARPKTAFDKVVERKHSADENVAEYGAKLERYRLDLNNYLTAGRYSAEYKQLCDKCDIRIADFDKKYAELSAIAAQVITEYFNDTNDDYITAKVAKQSIFTKSMFLKLAVVFFSGAGIALIFVILGNEAVNEQKIKKKKKMLDEIKQSGHGKAEA